MSKSSKNGLRGNQRVYTISCEEFFVKLHADPEYQRGWEELMTISDEEFLQQQYDALMALELEENGGEFSDRE